MLEIRQLTKVYKTKGGADVRALDNVSIKFEETGLVFLLGKSGSGKSTLLNLAGGLDEPTSGEVVVMGKSSKDFSGSDFDSYRNTFIGFVFQEYNVLNEFNVAENVALALELQGKTKEHDKVMKILEEVELSQFAKRKPNTLSGGQKQRIAIARALVKDPQIIMADEPTGALDSATSKQVFDTLKRLAKTRLVLVVSHDREFAELYGDRIVELKDGKIISDVTKVRDEAEPLSGKVKQIGLDTLSVEAGSVDDATMERIREFLTASKGNVVIARGEREIANYCRANHIDENGAQERFEDTTEEKLDIKQYNGKETKFIRSRLPARKAIKIGASGLKLKPFRLVLTILLSMISFVMFGLFSTMMFYDPDAVLVQSFMNSDHSYLTVKKKYELRQYHNGELLDYTSNRDAVFTPSEIEKFGDDAFGAYAFGNWGGEPISNMKVSQEHQNYYYPNITSVASLPANHPLRVAMGDKYPSAADEIAVSTYIADCAVDSTFTTINVLANGNIETGAEKHINSREQLVGETVALISKPFKVTAVFESGPIPSQYDALKNPNAEFSMSTYDFTSFLDGGLHRIIFVSDAFIEEYGSYLGGNNDSYVQYFNYSNNGIQLSSPEGAEFSYDYFTQAIAVYGSEDLPQLPVYFFGEQKTTLGSNELIVGLANMSWTLTELYRKSLDDLPQFGYPPEPTDEDFPPEPIKEYPPEPTRGEKPPEPIYEDYYDESSGEYDDEAFNTDHQQWQDECDKIDGEYGQALQEWQDKVNRIDNDNTAWEKWQEDCNKVWENYYASCQNVDKAKDAEVGKLDRAMQFVMYGSFSHYDEELQDYVTEKPTKQELADAQKTVKDFIASLDPFTVDMKKDDIGNGSFTVVGLFVPDPNSYSTDGFYCSQSFYDGCDFGMGSTEVWTEETNYVREDDAIYATVFVPLVKNEADFTALLSKFDVVDPTNDVLYVLQNVLYNNVEFVNTLVEELSLVFLIVGIVLMVFAALLLLNFITMSISNKTKEIGILRAVGARGTDVFKIFFSESGIIVGICAVLSIIGAFALAIFLNSYLKAQAGLQTTLFVFGPLSVVIMVAVAVLVALLGTFLPVFFASRKKPVDSIRAL